MQKTFAAVAIVVATLAASACERATSPVAPLAPGATANATKVINTSTYFFAKVPAAWAGHHITPAADVDIFDLDISTSETSSSLTRLTFMLAGNAQVGNLTNLRLVYYPDGRGTTGVVVASDNLAGWVNTAANYVTLTLATPLVLNAKGKNLSKSAVKSFSLLVDVSGAAAYQFFPQLQTVNVSLNGVERQLLTETCDLPLLGDTFYVNQ
jgi:hypothetical protein